MGQERSDGKSLAKSVVRVRGAGATASPCVSSKASVKHNLKLSAQDNRIIYYGKRN